MHQCPIWQRADTMSLPHFPAAGVGHVAAGEGCLEVSESTHLGAAELDGDLA